MIIIIFILILLILLLFHYINLNIYNKLENLENIKNIENKYVCMYAYYEKNNQYKENLKFFLDKAILDYIDYYIIINGKCTLDLPNKKNITIIYRKNEGFDFGAWSYCVKKYIYKKYDYYIFINSSVRGPYLSNPNEIWLEKFLKLFSNKDVKLVGTSINICSYKKSYFKYDPPYTHVQSMFFILNNEGFNFLLNKQFFDDEEKLNKLNINQVILSKEITMSQLILKNNWNINCILPKYKDYDYRLIKKNFNTSGEDQYLKNTYFGDTIKPEEVIFFKINRF